MPNSLSEFKVVAYLMYCWFSFGYMLWQSKELQWNLIMNCVCVYLLGVTDGVKWVCCGTALNLGMSEVWSF